LRLTLWHTLKLAAVVLIYSVILFGEIQQQEAETQHTQLAAIGQALAGEYSPNDGLIHFTPQTPAEYKANLPKSGAVAGPELPAQGVALLLNTQNAIAQTIGPLTPSGATALRGYLLTGSSMASSKPMIGANGSTDGYGFIMLPLESQAGAKTSGYATYQVSVISQGRVVGTLIVATPDAAKQAVHTALSGLLLAGPVALIVAAVGGYWLATRALHPVRLITRTAQEMSETDLSRRLNLQSNDELGELAATFDHMLGRLESAFARQRQFTADASHELRTPLTIVNLEASNALAAERTPAEYQRALEVIQEENQAMSRLVADLLTLARADAGHGLASHTRIDLSDVALDAVERLEPLARERGVRLLLAEAPEVILMGDRAALAQALVNLVENGVKYTATIGIAVTVAVRCVDAEDRLWAVASVSDDGPGIEAQHLPRLFDRFYRADPARKSDAGREGSGLGLAIAQWAARAHGGEVRVHSEMGAGSVFELWLPQCAQ
jgi:heavy metal sensor kinase